MCSDNHWRQCLMKKYVCFIAIIMLPVFISGVGCKKNGTEYNPNPLVLNFESIRVSVFGSSGSSVDLNVTGGTKPYPYIWSNGKITEDIRNRIAGAYLVTVTGENTETITDSTVFLQPNETGTVTDIDGNLYQTVKIGNQWWMAENLRVTRDSRGNPISSYVYNNDERMALTYGRLYTWQAMMNGSSSPGAQGISPDGWHIPSIDEWQILIDFLGGNAVAGGKMKEPGTEHWRSPNAGATNSSGLTLVASGSYVVSQNRFCDLKAGAHILTSSSDGDFGIFVAVASHSSDIGSDLISKTDIGFSVRCVKN
jgi:uncharacterized protein (TIGR02145 family)